MNPPPPSLQPVLGESSSDPSDDIEISSIGTRSDSPDIIGVAGPRHLDTCTESAAIIGLAKMQPRMERYELSDSTKDRILLHTLEMLEHYEAENQLLREQQYYLLELTKETGVSVTNPLNYSSTTSQLVPPSGKPFGQMDQLSTDSIVSEPDLATLRATTDSWGVGSANSQRTSSWASREVSPVDITRQPKTSTIMPSNSLRVEGSQETDHRPPSVFYSILSKISTIGQSVVEKASEVLGVGAPGASKVAATTTNLSYYGVALGLKASDPNAAKKWKLLKTKTADWLCLIQPDWETASGIRITTVMSLGNQIRNTPELVGINTREVPLRRLIFHIRNIRRKSRARKKAN